MSMIFKFTLAGSCLIFIIVIYVLASFESQSSSAQNTQKIQNRLATPQAIQINSNPMLHTESSRVDNVDATGHFVPTHNSDLSKESSTADLTLSKFSPASRSLALPLRQETHNTLDKNAVTKQNALMNQAPLSNFYPASSAPIWDIDEGLALPLVLSGKPTSRTDAMIAANEAITKKFEQDITPGQEATSEVVVTDEVWVNAKSNADGIFKILYGDAVYNARGMEAASSGIKK